MKPHPATFWIKYLVSTRKHNAEEINGMLVALDLGPIDAEDVAQMKRGMKIPKPFRPTALHDRPSQEFLRKEEIYSAWQKRKYFQEAYSILGNPQLRHFVETFILSPMRPAQAVKALDRKIGVHITLSAYRLFQHYWWNPSVMSGVEWGEYIANRDVAHKEWLSLAVHAQDANGSQLVLWKTGVLGKMHVEAGRMFRDMRNTAYMCFQQVAHKDPSLEHSTMLLNYSKVAKLAQEQAESSAGAAEDIIDSFNSFRMKQESPEVPSIKQLTAGNYSEAEDAAGDKEKLGDY